MAVATVLTNVGKNIITNRIRGASTEALSFAVGTGATSRTANVLDTELSEEYGSRTSAASAVVTTTTTGDTYQVVGSVTATSSVTINEYGLFNGAGQLFISATVTPISVISGDIVQYTTKLVF